MAHRILVADDDPDCRALIASLLEAWGYQVLCANCGQEALDLLSSESLDVAIIDLYMDDLSGLDVLREIRQRPGISTMPVLIISAEQDPASIRVALDFGATDYLTKPIDSRWLRVKVQRNLPETSDSQRDRLAKGARLGNYEIQDLLTTGIEHKIYLAQDLRLKRLIRLKVVTGSQPKESTERESVALASVHHPSVGAIYDVGFEPFSFIVTEYAPAKSLACLPAIVNERRIVNAIKWTMEILDGVEAIHAQGLVHANLNPENVLLRDDTGKIQLTDFSAAIWPESNAQNRGHATSSLAAFAAPEQIDALYGPTGPGADLFASAGLLYFLLTGSAPFTPTLPTQQLLSIAFAEPNPMMSRNCNVPPDLEAICLRGLQKDQNLRFRTVEQFRNELRPQLARAIRTSRPDLQPTDSRSCPANFSGLNCTSLMSVPLALDVA